MNRSFIQALSTTKTFARLLRAARRCAVLSTLALMTGGAVMTFAADYAAVLHPLFAFLGVWAELEAITVVRSVNIAFEAERRSEPSA